MGVLFDVFAYVNIGHLKVKNRWSGKINTAELQFRVCQCNKL
jgi:hypothetical protein